MVTRLKRLATEERTFEGLVYEWSQMISKTNSNKRIGGITLIDIKKLKRKLDKLEDDKMSEEYTSYAYLCPLCCYIMECPCFEGKICPKCGCDKPDILYLKINVDEANK